MSSIKKYLLTVDFYPQKNVVEKYFMNKKMTKLLKY